LARGDAETAIQKAAAYYAEKTGQANAEAAIFASRQGAYAQATGATRMRLYLEAVESVLPAARKFIVDEAVKLETTDLWIPGGNVQTFPVAP
jgi:membrane protease subunit HflK